MGHVGGGIRLSSSNSEWEMIPPLYYSFRSSPSGLAIQYSLKNVGMEYDRSLFGMKLSDCRCLAKCLEKSEVRRIKKIKSLNKSMHNLKS